MTKRTISINEYHNDNIVHIKAVDPERKIISLKNVIKPFILRGYKFIRATNSANGTLHAILEIK